MAAFFRIKKSTTTNMNALKNTTTYPITEGSLYFSSDHYLAYDYKDGSTLKRAVVNAAYADTAGALTSTLSIAKGGTGATEAAKARENLGVPPKDHAATATTYGAGTIANYGHVKLVSGAIGSSQTYADGVAAAAAHTHSQYLTSHQTMYYRPIKVGTTEILNNTTSTALTLSAGTGISLSNSSGVVTITNSSTNTDTSVTQTATTTDATYEVLFSGTADNTTHTEGAGKNSNLTFNPSTGLLTVTGNLYIKNPGGTSDWTNPEKFVLVGASNKEFSFQMNHNGNNVDVGWDWDTGVGSGLGLRGSNDTAPGQFFLYARNSTSGYAGLAGDANGVLRWNNRRVVTATNDTQVGSASQPIYINASGYATAGNTIPTITLNGSATTTASLYAPTGAGTSGQLLKSSGSGAPTWATITASDVGAATANHSHTLSIASTTEAANIVLSANGFYKLTAGNQTYNFQLPADNDTKNTAGATEVAANTIMWIVGATGQTANPQTYTKTGAKIDADGGLLGKTITVDTHVTLTYDSTAQSLKFIFN